VLEGDILSAEGVVAYNTAIDTLASTEGVTGVPTGLWNTLESERVQNPILDDLLGNLTSTEGFALLKTYLLENATGREIVDSLLYTDGQQTIISFQANTLDWQATVDFEEALSASLRDASTTVEGNFTMNLSGRALILAQISGRRSHFSDYINRYRCVYDFVRIDHHSVHPHTKHQAGRSTWWRDLDSFDHCGHVGIWHHGDCRLSIEFTDRNHRCTGAWIGC